MNIFDSTGLLKNSTGGLANYDVIILRDEKAQNTAGGTFTSGAWRTRDLNVEVIDTGGYCTLSSNQFTLASGTYEIQAIAPANCVDMHQTRLQNITDGTTTIIGSNAWASSGLYFNTDSLVVGRFTITSTKTFEIQHRCAVTNATFGFGGLSNFTTEVYTQVFLRKTPATTTGLGLTDASQAQQETATATTVYVTPGRQQYHPSAAKAWVNFNGTGTVAIRASYNVSSITDSGAGDYIVNWDTDFSSANYCVKGSCSAAFNLDNASLTVGNSGSGADDTAPLAGSVCIQTRRTDTAALFDAKYIMVVAFGDQ